MEIGPVTPGLARVIWDIHSLYGSYKSGMSLAYTIEDRHGNRTPLFRLRGTRLGILPKLPLCLAAARLCRVQREHMTGS
eukprot:9395499-Pyramimonas_sp.AAC.1